MGGHLFQDVVVGGVVALGFFVVQWVVVPARMLGRLERRSGQ